MGRRPLQGRREGPYRVAPESRRTPAARRGGGRTRAVVVVFGAHESAYRGLVGGSFGTTEPQVDPAGMQPRQGGDGSAISSLSESLTTGRVDIRHSPFTCSRAPLSNAPTTSSRTYSALPPLVSYTQLRAPRSTGPPAISSASALVSSPLNNPSSNRGAPASFHKDTIASGHRSPLRTVVTSNAVAVLAGCSANAADVGSSHCASSSAITNGAPAARSCNARMLS